MKGYTKLHDEQLIGLETDRSVAWLSRTTVEVEDATGTVYIEQGGDQLVLPPEYIPGIIKALEKALEKP